MPEHEGIFAGIDRDLIEHIGVIAVKRLAVGRLLLHGVVSPGMGDHGSTDCKTALFLDGERHGLIVPASRCTCCSKHACCDQQECVE